MHQDVSYPSNRSEIQILHVDDDKTISDLLYQLVVQHEDDLSLHSRQSGVEAIRCLETTPVDCVISDYRMPGMTGLELLETVRDRWGDLPFILFTGQGDESVAERAINNGVTDYFQKGLGKLQYAILVNRARAIVRERRARTELEEELRIEKEHFRMALENSPYVAFRLDTDLRYTWVYNPHQDFDEMEVLGKRDDDLLPPEAAETVLAPKRKALRTGDRVREEVTYELPSGEVTYDLTIEPLRNEDGEIIGLTCASMDITERKQQETKVLERKKHLEAVVTATSHDLQNPLMIADGCITLARDTGDLSNLDSAHQALDQAAKVLEYLKTVAEKGAHTIDPTTVELREVAEVAWNTTVTGDASLVVERDLTLIADEWRLQELFHNLFANSVAYAGDDARVRVGPLEEKDGFFVEDGGPGIDEAERARVFEMGYSGNGSTGFGLAICRQIADAHGWTIEISDGPTRGVRFEVSGIELA